MVAAVPLPPIYPSDAARFYEFVERRGPDDCWPFTGGKVNGYGSFRLGKRKVRAHRVAWVMWSGEPEPDPALQLDHHCHDPKVCRGSGPCPHRACCNPAHLRPATAKQNIANSYSSSAQRRERKTCGRGHLWNAKNTRVWIGPDGNSVRMCRACQREDARVRMVRKGRRPDFDTHCPHGHPWTPENTRIDKKGSRVCRACPRERRVAAAQAAT